MTYFEWLQSCGKEEMATELFGLLDYSRRDLNWEVIDENSEEFFENILEIMDMEMEK